MTDSRPTRVRWGFFAAVAAVVVFADQATKFWAVDALTNLTSDLTGLGPRLHAKNGRKRHARASKPNATCRHG